MATASRATDKWFKDEEQEQTTATGRATDKWFSGGTTSSGTSTSASEKWFNREKDSSYYAFHNIGTGSATTPLTQPKETRRTSTATTVTPQEQKRQNERDTASANRAQARTNYGDLRNIRDSIQAQADDMLAEYNQRIENGEKEEDLVDEYMKILAKQDKVAEYDKQIASAYDTLQTAKQDYKDVYADYNAARDELKAADRALRIQQENITDSNYGENLKAAETRLANAQKAYEEQGGKVNANVIDAGLRGSAAGVLDTFGYLQELAQPENEKRWGIFTTGHLTDQQKHHQEALAEREKEKYEAEHGAGTYTETPGYMRTQNIAAQLAKESAEQTASMKAGRSELGQLAVDMGVQGVQMAADAAAGRALPGGSLTAMALRTFGSSVREARDEGANIYQQGLYGAGSAAVEVLTEKLFDGLAGVYGAGAADDLVSHAIGRFTNNRLGQAALGWAAEAVGEGFEEVLSDLANPFLRSIYDEDVAKAMYTGNIADRWRGYWGQLDPSEVGYDFLVGAAMGFAGGSVENVAKMTGLSAPDARAKFFMEAGEHGIKFNDAVKTWQKHLIKEGYATQTSDTEITNQANEYLTQLDNGKKVSERKINKLNQRAANQIATEDIANTVTGVQQRMQQLGLNDERMAQAIAAVALENEAERIGAKNVWATEEQRRMVERNPIASRIVSEMDVENLRREQAAGIINQMAEMTGASQEELQRNIAPYQRTNEWVKNLKGNKALASDVYGTLNTVTEAEKNAVTLDGEKAKIVGAENGKVTVEQNGERRTVDIAELKNMSESFRELVEAAPAGQSGEAFLRLYREGQDIGAYTKAWDMAENMYGAQTNVSYEEARSKDTLRVLTDTQLKTALEMGRSRYDASKATAEQRAKQLKAAREEAKKNGAKARKKGTVNFNGGEFNGKSYKGVDLDKLSRPQKNVVAMVNALADAVNINFVVYDGEANTGGSYLQGGTVMVNINAGEFAGKIIGAATLSHELTHYLQDFAPEQYQELKDFITSEILKKSPEQFDKLVQKQMDLEPDLSYDEATDELIANACQTMLLNSEAVTKLARQNMSLAEKIADWINDTTEKIKAAFADVDLNDNVSVYAAAKSITDVMDEAQKLWDKALEAADENYNAAQATGMKSEGGDKIQYSKLEKQEVLHLKEQVRNNLWRFKGMDPVAKVQSGIKFDLHNIQASVSWVSEMLGLPIQVNRKGLGNVGMTKKRVNRGFDYLPKAKNEAYRTQLGQAYTTAMLAVPDVIEQGVEIEKHENHKEYGHATRTFSAPVELDGQRGILTVVVKQTTGNFYDVHCIMTPDGDLLVLDWNEKAEALTGGVSSDETVAPAMLSADTSIADEFAERKSQNQKLSVEETAEERAARKDSAANLKAENKILRARAEYWKAQTRKTKENTVRQQDTDRLARDLLNKYESRADKAEVKGALKELGDWLVQTDELDYNELYDKAEAIAEDIISGNYALLDNSQQENLERLKDFLKSTPVNLTAADFRDTGDEGFRKKYGRYFTVRENGRTIDSLWGEMAAMFGEGVFPEDTYAPGDMLNMIADYLDLWKPQYGNEFEMYHGEAVDAVTNEIIDSILSEEVRQTPGTFADKAQQKLNAQIAKDKEKLDTLRAAKNARIEELKRQAAEKNAQIRLAEKAAKYEAVSKVKQHYQDMLKRQRNKRGDTAVRTKIKKLHKELTDILLKPREGRYVPKELVKATAEILGAVDTTSGRAVKAKAALAELKVKYDALAKDPKYSLTYDETVSGMLQSLAENLGDGSIYDLTGQDLEGVYNTLRALKHTIQTANKLVGSQIEADAFEAANQMMNETENAKGIPTKALRKVVVAQMTPSSAFRMFGGYVKNSMWEQMFNELNRGQLTQTQVMMEGGQIFRELIDDRKNMDKLHDRKNLVDIGLKDGQGNAIKVTRGMMLSVYMHLLNEQNARHVAYGGLTVPRLAQYYKNKMQDAYKGETGRAVAFAAEIAELNRQLDDAETVEAQNEIKEKIAELQDQTDAYMSNLRAQIEKQLTDYDRKWIAAAQEFFDVYSKGKLNEVTEQVYGFSKAQVDNYFPIHTDPDYRAANFETIARDMSLENAGFMKERVNGTNPILLEDITDVISSQLRRTAQYVGLMPAIRNFNKVYGKARAGYSMSVQSAMARAFENEGKKYIENLMADLNGARKTEANIWDELRGRMAGAVLTLNPRVTLAQTASFPTAAAEIGYKPLAKALVDMKNPQFSEALRDEIAKWTPLWWYRMQGFSTTELGDIKNNEQFMNWAMSKMKWLTGWIQWADGYTTGALWQASKYYVDDNFSDLKKGSDEYMMKVAEVYNRVIEKTQPDYTTLQRPDILRNPNAIVKQLTMFMTQRLQNTNLLYDAAATYSHYVRDAKNGRNGVTNEDVKIAGKRLAWAVSSQVAASMTIVIFKALADTLMHNLKAYRDDDEELTEESVSKTMIQNFIETLSGNILWGSEAYSFLKSVLTGERYYGVSLNGVETFTDALSDGNKMLQNYLKGNKEAGNKAAWKLAKSVAQFFGIPLGNLEKFGQAVVNHIEDAKNGTFMEAGVDRTRAQNTRILFNALQSGDTAKAERIRAQFESEKEIRSALKGYIHDQYVEQNLDRQTTARLLQRYAGMTKRDAEKSALEWMMEIREGIKFSELRDEFLDGNVSKAKAVKYLETYGKYAREEAEAKLTEWSCEKETGVPYSDIPRAVKTGEITPEKGRQLLIKYGGMDEDKAQKTVNGYEIEMEYDIQPSELEQAYMAFDISDAEALDILQRYKYYGKDDAEEKSAEELERMQFVRENPDAEDITITQVRNYRASGLDGFVSASDFFQAAKMMGTFNGYDEDGNGKTDRYSVAIQKLEYIDSFDLSPEQKTALAIALGINEKTIRRKAPWR